MVEKSYASPYTHIIFYIFNIFSDRFLLEPNGRSWTFERMFEVVASGACSGHARWEKFDDVWRVGALSWSSKSPPSRSGFCWSMMCLVWNQLLMTDSWCLSIEMFLCPGAIEFKGQMQQMWPLQRSLAGVQTQKPSFNYDDSYSDRSGNLWVCVQTLNQSRAKIANWNSTNINPNEQLHQNLPVCHKIRHEVQRGVQDEEWWATGL